MRLSPETTALANSFGYELPDDLVADPPGFNARRPLPRMQEEMVEVRGLATCLVCVGIVRCARHTNYAWIMP